MIEAFANHFSSHLGRHLFYWATGVVSSETESENGINLKISNIINKFHAPLERGVQILDHLLTLEEEDFNDHWGSAYNHNYVPELAGEGYGNNGSGNAGIRGDHIIIAGCPDVGNQEVINYHNHHMRPYIIRRNSE